MPVPEPLTPRAARANALARKAAVPSARARVRYAESGRATKSAGSFKRSVQRGCDLVSGVHVGELVHFTIDDEGWCAGDAELFGCLVDVRHLLAQVAIVHAGIEVGLGLDAMTLANGLEHGLQDAVLRRFNDAGLVFEQLVQHVEILVFARAHGDEVGRHIRCVQWVFAEDEFHLAGVDIVRLDNWLDVVMPVFAGRAGG